jgi:translin
LRPLHSGRAPEEWETAESLIAKAKTAAETWWADVARLSRPLLCRLYPGRHERVCGGQPDLCPGAPPTVTHRQNSGREANTWLNGLAEAATELRRRILDIIRHDHSDEAEVLLQAMDQIYSILVTFDFSDSVTGGLRRRTDTVRAVLERTRGDITTSLRQTRLEAALASLESKIFRRNMKIPSNLVVKQAFT